MLEGSLVVSEREDIVPTESLEVLTVLPGLGETLNVLSVIVRTNQIRKISKIKLLVVIVPNKYTDNTQQKLNFEKKKSQLVSKYK